MRKLATIREIAEIKPIPDADRIEVARIDGWEVVVSKKDSFNHKYDLQIVFMKERAYTPIYIYGVMQYYLRGQIR